ncbi:MAG: flavodoxin domain-containing protein [Spirochaetes bacterium]|nr:flavodoxin domain-containing protein [Spirochaetota bacterium]
MNKILIVYHSVYGSTKKYAEWIAEELNGEICDVDNSKQKDPGNYDIIILGNGLYAGKIKGTNLFTDNYEKLKDKKLAIFTCGLADFNKAENVNNVYKLFEKLIPKNILENIKIFNLRGAIDYKKLNAKHKMMMWMMKKVTEKKGEKMDDDDKFLLETYGETIDFMDKNSIKEIIEYCKS